jgi:hypothetical protein
MAVFNPVPRRAGGDLQPPNVVAVAVFLVPLLIGIGATLSANNPWGAVAGALVGVVLMQSPKVAQQWERAIVLRLGRYRGMYGPGLFWVVPFVDTVASRIDQRIITTGFAAEQTLTSDTVPVNVDAVLFWMVHDAQRAALEVQEYREAVSWAAQTALRDIIGRTPLTDLLRGRRMRCRAKRRRRAKSRRGSSSARRSSRSRTRSRKRRNRISTIRLPSTCAR